MKDSPHFNPNRMPVDKASRLTRDVRKKNLPKEQRVNPGDDHDRAVPYRRNHKNLTRLVVVDGLGEDFDV